MMVIRVLENDKEVATLLVPLTKEMEADKFIVEDKEYQILQGNTFTYVLEDFVMGKN